MFEKIETISKFKTFTAIGPTNDFVFIVTILKCDRGYIVIENRIFNNTTQSEISYKTRRNRDEAVKFEKSFFKKEGYKLVKA